ncbi:hypothetical protein QTO16_27490 [Vibrio harveyi]|uniref:hypothetical protein n=1 Tax=Vibrio harveyi TaxID=669 RepID=UPI0012FD6CBE|nr:hypothetical protein [Vibrio harveyi]MCR9770351.1 hypothetical protein [Vibrio harveyi]HDM8140741.1 hypothetical protein [Vibrio harveyi]
MLERISNSYVKIIAFILISFGLLIFAGNDGVFRSSSDISNLTHVLSFLIKGLMGVILVSSGAICLAVDKKTKI